MMANSKEDALKNGKEALTGFGSVGSVSYEGGDGGPGREWHSDYRVWPADDATKAEIIEDCEDHYNGDYVLSPSMTDDQYDYLYITVRTV